MWRCVPYSGENSYPPDSPRPSAGTNAFSALRIPAGRWWNPRRKLSRVRPRVRSGDRRKPVRLCATHRVLFALPAGIPNAINAALGPLTSVLHSSFFMSPQALRGTGGWAQRRVPKRDGSRLGSPALRTTPFVQQVKRQNTPRARNSLFHPAQGVARFWDITHAQNSGAIRATRGTGRGTL